MAPVSRKTSLSRLLNQLLDALMPAYLQKAAAPDNQSHQNLHEAYTSRVSYLDGLRGYASLIVFISHFLEPFVSAKRFGYGFGENNCFLQLPIIRILYSGVPMVALFFIIYGYALSYKHFLALRHHPAADLSDTLASAIFRRGIRLFLPTIVSTFLVMITVRLHIHDSPDYTTLPGVIETRPHRFTSGRDQVVDWSRFVVTELTNPWDWRIREYAYDSHLWTIPIEFRASLILFLLLTCTLKIHRLHRLAISAALWAYCVRYGKWHVALFICGMSFADFAVASGSTTAHSHRYWRVTGCLVPLLMGSLLLSFPVRNGDKTPSYVWLSQITANCYTWHAFGAMLVLWALENSVILQRAFVSSFARYLGKISYALYIVHGPALHSVGYGITSYLCRFCEETNLSHHIGLFLSSCLVAPVVFWWADVFERLVDGPTVKLARWLYGKVRAE